MKMYPIRCSRQRHRRGFTLVELLVTMVILAILMAIFFGIQRGVYTAQSKAKVQAEMAVIANALEQFKNRYGDYPWANTPGGIPDDEYLFEILDGNVYIDRGDSETGPSMATGDRKALIDTTSFELEPVGTTLASGARILDPWGNPYVYYYRANASDANWENPGFILMSKGGTGEVTLNGVDTSGIISNDFYSAENNHDVIIYGYEN